MMPVMKAVTVVGRGNVALSEVPIPEPGPGEILIKVHSAAQNPADWKFPLYFTTEGSIIGCDLSGTVHAVGQDIPPGLRPIGERVAAFVHGGIRNNGGFAEYVVTDARLVIPIPATWSFEDAAQVSVASLTACQCLYQSLGFPMPPEKPTESPIDLLVWGGSSSVGQYVIQLARLSGVRIIATSSPRNFALLRSLGADLVFSHSDPETPTHIRAATAGRLKHAVDCISEGDTAEKIAQSIGTGGGIVSIILNNYSISRKDIQCKFSLGYLLLGKDFDFPIKCPADPDMYSFGVTACNFIADLLAKGELQPGPVRILPNGLASVKDGLQYMYKGKVSGEKLVYRIADTPKQQFPPTLVSYL